MSLGFKRVMSSIMAFVMMVSTLVMVNVASVSAASYVISGNEFNMTTDTNEYKSGDTITGTFKFTITSVRTDTFKSEDGTSYEGSVRVNSASSGAGIEFDTVNSDAKLTIIASSSGSARDIYLDGTKIDGQTIPAKVDEQVINIAAKGSHKLTFSGNINVLYLRLDDGDVVRNIYTISGTSNLAEGETFNVGDYTANVGANGVYTVSVSAATSPFADGQTLSVSKAGYTVEPISITLSAGSDANSFTGTDLTFTKIPMVALAEGTYDVDSIVAGLPNFEITNSGNPTELNRLNTGSDDNIKFMVNDNATVTVTYASASDSKTCAAAIYSGETQVIAGTPADGTNQTVTATDLRAGTYTIKVIEGTGGSTSARIKSISVSYEEAQEPTPVNVTVGGVVSNAEGALQGAQVTAAIGSDSKSITSEAGGTFNFTFSNITPDASGSVVVTLTTTMAGYKTDETIVTLGAADSYTKSDVAIKLEAETTEPSGEITYPDGYVKEGAYKGTKSNGVSEGNGFFTSAGVASGSAEIKFNADNGYFSFVMETAGTIQFGPITGDIALYDANGNRTEIGTDAINLNAGQYYVMGAANAKIAKISGMEANIIITYTGTVVNSYTITGTVKNTNGEPIANATVTAGTYSAKTNEKGEYTITVADGSTIDTVSVTAEGYVSDSESPEDGYSTDAVVNFTLYRDATEVVVTGKVTDGSNPIPNASVTITMNSTIIASTSRTVVTNDEGVYSASFTVATAEADKVTASVSVSALGYNTATVATTPAPTDGTITQDITLSLTESAPSTGKEYVWTAVEKTDLLGDNVNNLSTGSYDDTASSKFEETIFTDSDGNPTGSLQYQTYVSISAEGVQFTPQYSGKMKFYVVTNTTGQKRVTVSNGTTNVYDGMEPGRKKESNIQPIEFDVEAGVTYTFAGYATYLYRAVLTTGEGSTVDPFNLSVKVMDGTTPVNNATITVNGVIKEADYSNGVYTIRDLTSAVTSVAASAAGYASGSVTGLNITTANADEPVTVSLTKRTDVTVQFTVTGDDANSAITIKNVTKNETQKLTSGTKTFTADIGDKFTFEGSANNIYMWGADKGTINYYNMDSTKYFIYNLPDDAVAGETYTVTFTGKNDVAKEIANTKDDMKALDYGQYGFGDDKKKLCGNDAREFTSFAFITATMRDYAKSFSEDVYNGIDQTSEIKTANQYGIISNASTSESFVKFQLADSATLGVNEVNVTIDMSGNITLTDETENKPVGTAGGKTTFKLTPGHTYIIKDNAGVSYIKSIRLFNPNNVFNNAEATNKQVANLGDANTLLTNDAELANALNLNGSEGTVFRIIGQIALADADKVNPDSALSVIDEVGFDVYDEEAYNTANNDVTGGFYYNDALSSMLESGSETAPDYDEIRWADIVNSAVDTNNDGVPEIGNLGSVATGDDLYVQTFFATETNKVLIPWVRYSGSNTKVYSECPKTGENVAITLEVK